MKLMLCSAYATKKHSTGVEILLELKSLHFSLKIGNNTNKI